MDKLMMGGESLVKQVFHERYFLGAVLFGAGHESNCKGVLRGGSAENHAVPVVEVHVGVPVAFLRTGHKHINALLRGSAIVHFIGAEFLNALRTAVGEDEE